MSRHMFSFSVLLFFVLLMAFGSTAVYAERNTRNKMKLPEAVDLFVARQTTVVTHGLIELRDSFAFPSLASAGGVLVALAEGNTNFQEAQQEKRWVTYADVVAGYIDSAKSWPSFVAEVRANDWKAHSIFNTSVQEEHNGSLRYVYKPTTISKGNKVFLLVGGPHHKYDSSSKKWTKSSRHFDLLVGETTQDKVIQWGKPTSLWPQIKPSAKQRGLKQLLGGGGSGVVMEDGTLVFPVTAREGGVNNFVCMIIYSKDDGKNWVLAQGVAHSGCTDPLIVEWERGQLLMVAKCNSLSKVFESRDMGATWTGTVRILTRLSLIFLPNTFLTADTMESLTTASIAGKKVMLYTQKGVPPGDTLQTTALYLWVTDNNRTFHVGPISMDTTRNRMTANTLLHSNDALHLLQERASKTTTGVSLASLTDALKTITSILETWAKLDASLSNSSVPTAGLVGVLSDASGDGTWSDAYRCVDATVTNATKVEDGFKFTGSVSYAMWPVNMRKYHNVHGFVNYAFTLVATVTIDEVPNGSAPLLDTSLEDNEKTTFVGLSYTTEKRWETVFNGTPTRSEITWEVGKAYQVALVLRYNEGFVYVDGVLVGSSDTLPTSEAQGHDISYFHFGGGIDGSATVKNVFLYNRRLSVMQLKKVDNSIAFWKSAGDSSKVSEKRAGDSSKASEHRPGDSSKAFEHRPGDSSSAFEQRAGDSSDASEQRAGDSSKVSEKRAVDSSKVSEHRAGDSSMRADVFLVLICFLGLWGVAALVL
uniref:Group II trans-sialidase superfamily n=1 Tax=Trypanosoma rangeli TaxID=5698 RepID=C3U1A7_TRYRA|nr:group II trans-sialidase superfamily [Trypanosoma rangeli]